MDDIINIFVTSNYTEEAAEDLYQALGLFRVYNYLEVFAEIEEILMMESFQETVSMVDNITQLVMSGQAYILDRHGIKLNESATLAINNEFLRVLYQLQSLESPESVLKIIESFSTDEEKLSDIMEMFTNKSSVTYMDLIEEIRPVCMDSLKAYLYAQEDNQRVAVTQSTTIAAIIRLYKEVFGINAAVRTILDSDTIMGEPFEVYRPLFDELREIVHDENVLLETLLFLLLFSSDGHSDPMKVFEEHSDYLVADLTTTVRLSRTLGEMYNKITRYKEQKSYEKA